MLASRAKYGVSEGVMPWNMPRIVSKKVKCFVIHCTFMPAASFAGLRMLPSGPPTKSRQARREPARPLEERKAKLARLLRRSDGIRLVDHTEEDGARVFDHACRLGYGGVVSKRLGPGDRSGRCRTWIKARNPDSPAARRIDEGSW